MTIRLPTNPFLGINPLLSSLLQGRHYDERGVLSPSLWRSSHTQHINHIADALNTSLIPLGYVAIAEQALQIQPDEPLIYPDQQARRGALRGVCAQPCRCA